MPDEKQYPEFFTPYARNLVRFKARMLSRRPGLLEFDLKDLQHDLWVAVFEQASRFNPDRASANTFVNRVVKSAVRALLRDHSRKKRFEGRHSLTIDLLVKEDNHIEPFANTIGEAERCRHQHSSFVDDATRAEDAEALEAAFESMDPKTVRVCRALMNGSISSAARDLGTSRRQIRNAIAEAREHLQEAGF